MVNANKHRKVTCKFGMLPIEDDAFMQKFNESIINVANEDSKYLIDVLNGLHDELTQCYDSLAKRNNGSVLKTGSCQRILEIYEWVFVTKNTIQYNYHMLTIDGDVIKSILSACDSVLNEFKNVQAIQNKNIDRKIYGGYFSVKYSDRINNTNVPKEMFENVIRLQEPIKLGNDDLN